MCDWVMFLKEKKTILIEIFDFVLIFYCLSANNNHPKSKRVLFLLYL